MNRILNYVQCYGNVGKVIVNAILAHNQCDQMDILIYQYLAIYSNEQRLLTYSQSGEILPNLVTLLTIVT